jgi:hypothetical protein
MDTTESRDDSGVVYFLSPANVSRQVALVQDSQTAKRYGKLPAFTPARAASAFVKARGGRAGDPGGPYTGDG